MIIGMDGNEANIVERVGVNTYAYELIKNLWKLQGEWNYRHKLIVYLKENPLSHMPKETENFKYKVIRGSRLWILTKLTPDLWFDKHKPDIFFSPSHYVPFLAPMPKICAVMDLGYLDNTAQFTKKVFWQLRLWTAISILVSKKVFAISQSTKENIVRHYPWSLRKVHVTYLAYDKIRFNQSISEKDVRHVRNTYSIVDDYVLYLGTLKPSKNIESLITAFHAVISNFQFPISKKMQLVIAGKKGWMFNFIYNKVKELKIEDRVVFTGFVPEEDKPGLVKGAKAFVIPSLWEGFGLDALTAMACGVPVIASNVGSLPEVVGEAGILVDPNSSQSIAGGIGKVLTMNKTEYNSIVKKGLEQVKKFSWEKTARETLKMLESIN